MNKILSLVFCCLLLSLNAEAQLIDLKQLQINGQLPETLLNSRTVVLVRTNEKGRNTQKEAWKELAEKAHPYLKEIGIDAVAYYDWRNVNAGPDATPAFAQAFRDRAIDNLLFLERKEGHLTLTVAPVGKESLTPKAIPAWQSEGDLAAIMEELRNASGKANLQLGNFLIIDQPEYFYTTDIRLNKRFFSYPLDLNMDKLAVPAYEIFQEENQSDSLISLKAAMQAYPYEWGTTLPGTEEKDLRLKEGYPFVLLYLHTNTANIRRFLDYGANNEIPLELQADVEDDRSVYKFYIRHIYTGDVYAGTHWDAAESWQEALQNFLTYLRKEQAANIK